MADALLEHLQITLQHPWQTPDPDLQAHFDALDAVPWRETLASEHYLDTTDTPTHDDTDRREAFLAALANVRALADARTPLDWSALQQTQRLVLGRPAPFRTGPALADHGREIYGWWPDLEAMFTRKLTADDRDGAHPVAAAARLYLDLIYFHPFEDGNARAARLWLEFTLRRARIPTPRLTPLIKWPKRPRTQARYQRFQTLLARAIAHTNGART